MRPILKYKIWFRIGHARNPAFQRDYCELLRQRCGEKIYFFQNTALRYSNKCAPLKNWRISKLWNVNSCSRLPQSQKWALPHRPFSFHHHHDAWTNLDPHLYYNTRQSFIWWFTTGYPQYGLFTGHQQDQQVHGMQMSNNWENSVRLPPQGNSHSTGPCSHCIMWKKKELGRMGCPGKNLRLVHYVVAYCSCTYSIFVGLSIIALMLTLMKCRLFWRNVGVLSFTGLQCGGLLHEVCLQWKKYVSSHYRSELF